MNFGFLAVILKRNKTKIKTKLEIIFDERYVFFIFVCCLIKLLRQKNVEIQTTMSSI